jgi:TolB-like protein/AraC-like DNA-binding protein
MPESTTIENDFLSQVTTIVEKNISNEQFGVSELAGEMNMSRSNLLRKVKKVTKLSVSQMISQVRLKRSMEMLRKSSLNVSEVSHQVGFSSTSYFIKCFREYYGYPPGEVGKRDTSEPNPTPIHRSNRKLNLVLAGSIGLIVALAVGFILYKSSQSSTPLTLEKSIAVLPFRNESNDSTNVYLINGLMESTLTNLQNIKCLKVISRTSVEKYRNTSKSIPEMAGELAVSYFVEGSGQKIGEGILLNIQLIEASTDKHLWARQYRREAKDIFDLQQEIAKDIAQEIKVIITPEEEKRIEKDPTDNLDAYDNFLKGKDLFYKSTAESLTESIPYFKKAIELDNQFALAYANAVMVYYYLDFFRAEKKYTDEINGYADRAMLLDSKLGESLIAKALDYAHEKEYKSAVPYLEKALEYNPNSGLVIHFLTEFYSLYVPNPAKYIEYALKGVRVDIVSSDSTTLSFKYFHLSNALIQAGFIDEGIKYVDRSLAYDPKNPFSGYLGVLFRYAKNKDLKLTRALLIKEFEKDTGRVDIVKEVGKVCYVMRDYKNAYQYYEKFIQLRKTKQWEIFKEENISIAFVLSKMGFKKKSEEFIKSFKDYADNDPSIYKHFHLAMYYSYRGDASKAIEHMKLFAKEDNYYYWILLLSNDPIVEPIKDLPDFKKVMSDLETKFWNNHKKIKRTLEEKELL